MNYLICVFCFFISFSLLAKPDTTSTLTLSLQDCISAALQKSAKIQEAEAIVQEYQGRLQEVQSLYYPKLKILSYISPMFQITGNALQADVDRDYSSWGPYYHLEAILSQPLYSFGRISAGENAAKERMLVEKARVREAKNMVALEVSKMYYLYLYAKSIYPALQSADETLQKAFVKADELYQKGTGEVTRVDLAKIQYFVSEIQKYLMLAQTGQNLALSALKHVMGFRLNDSVFVKDEYLSSPENVSLDSLENYILLSSKNRPEWEQLAHGEQAALSLKEAEHLANYPIFFFAGYANLNYTHIRTDTPNPYHFNPYNLRTGGIGLGLVFDLDPTLTKAKEASAQGIVNRVQALKAFASTGIPVQVKKSYEESKQYYQFITYTQNGMNAAKKWMLFSAADYMAGVGEAKDLLEGVGAFVKARKDYYENLKDYYSSYAELLHATGTIVH